MCIYNPICDIRYKFAALCHATPHVILNLDFKIAILGIIRMISFLQDGKIEAEVKLTGILSLGALQPGEARKYGTMIAPGLYAPVHQHFFVARMDMSVDCKPGESHNQVSIFYPNVLRACLV